MGQSKDLRLYIRSEIAQETIEATLKGRKDDFTVSLLTAVNSNPLLQECEAPAVIRTALKAASMRLPIDPNLGLAHIIPYRNKKQIKTFNERGVPIVKDEYVYEPQLQIGWKGFVQLALRTRQYKTINVTDVRKGEYKGINRLTGEIDFRWVKNEERRKSLEVTGYVAYFRLHDGFEKTLYMTVEELLEHAKKYSKSFQKGFGKWKDDFDSMARKTVVKLLLSKWGPQSTEMQLAFRADQAAMGDDDAFDYVDNDKRGKGDDEGIDAPAPDDTDQRPDSEKAADQKKNAVEGELVNG